MSAQAPIYIMWGVKMPYPKGEDADAVYEALEGYRDDAFNPDSVNAKDGITVLFDGMNGEYIAIGHVLARSDAYGQELGDHVIPNVADITLPSEMMKYVEWNKAITRCLEDAGIPYDASEPINWHVIQHYR